MKEHCVQVKTKRKIPSRLSELPTRPNAVSH